MQIVTRNIYQYQPLWDKWQVDELIGQGVFGKVYRISYQEYGHTYISAVKMISIPGGDQYQADESLIGSDKGTIKNYYQEMIQSLVNEANILYSLSGNSNILGYHDHKIVKNKETSGWDILIRMEYAKSLKKYLSEKTMTTEEVISLGIDLCTALAICAQHGILHRDIKCENIFISEDGIFKLGDFGIAMNLLKSNRTANMQGTPHYMAPEVYHGDQYDGAADIYSLGIVMYRLVNHRRLPGMPPYPEEVYPQDSKAAFEKRMNGEPFPGPDQAGAALSKVIMKACAYQASDRYKTPQKMKRDLEKVLFSMPVAAKKETVTTIEINSSEPRAGIRNNPDLNLTQSFNF
ncbi:MAG TPA: hypothetical protein DD640_07830 [Clostridiales bacterium]|nr:hypothetical protein [Clostridiales bacterium]